MVITGKDIPLFRLHALRAALKMQIVGLRRRGRQASTIIKEEFGIPKNKSLKETLAILDKVIEDVTQNETT